ncbi:T9SS type A sorting domain-containing protein [Lunatibacter salilacus]|uniref:T9SS type A sorting domain-containing protein n=1 Tax=Lunatibacter salilacus TaxID=2483804 RepID=UPI00131BC37A|nr:T9SS type A sorting domain-containing protein [Lunatibacter salilacus]
MNLKIYFLPLILILACSLSLNAQIIFQDDFESGALKPEWTAIPGADNAVVGVYNQIQNRNAFYRGTYGVAMGKTSSAGGAITNRLDLKLDLSAYSEVEMEFFMNNYYDATHPQDGIYLSDNNGSTFIKVMNFDGSNWAANVYGKLPPLDIGKLAKHYGLNLTPNFIIRFQQHGIYSFGGGSSNVRDGILIDDIVVRVPNKTYISIFPYSTGFEGSFEFPEGWKQANPTFPYIDPSVGSSTGLINEASTVRLEGVAEVGSTISGRNAFRNGQNGLILGKRVPGQFGAVAVDLHLNLSNTPDIELSFWMNNFYENTHPLDGIYFSDDAGSTFTKVMDFDGDKWAIGWGKLPPLDIDKLAKHYGLALSSTFIVRFQQYDNYSFGGTSTNTRDGIFIDDVEVRVPDQTYISTFPYITGFEDSLDFPAGWKQANPTFPYINPVIDNSTALLSGASTVRLEGVAEIGSTISERNAFLNGQNGLILGKRVGGEFGAVAVDLHLDLSDTPDVEMSFWMNNYYENTHPLDGIYFSDNAGVTFKKVMDFDGNNWANVSWGKLPPIDIDRLASHHGLALTSTFIIRFQQYDDYSFGGNSSNTRDGIFIDDVEIKAPDQTYISTFPYSTGFEGSIELPKGWKQANPTFPYINPVISNSTGLISGASTVRLEGIGAVGSTISGQNAFLNGQNGLILGKSVGGEFGAVAVDLHLDLSNTPDVELSFWMNNYYENTHPLDGIYFSDNAGESFTKVMDFEGDNWSNLTWSQLPPLDIDRLASQYGLTLSSTFIIRFQQYDDYSFAGNAVSTRDGIFIDDVEVRVPNQTYISTFPYSEGFESSEQLPAGWHYANPTFPYITPSTEFSTGIVNQLSTVRLEGGVGVSNVIGGRNANRSGQRGLFLGKRAGGVLGTTAADLKLNLKNAENVILKFWVYSNYEKLHPQDGIYLSNDGGIKFQKIYDFNFTSRQISWHQLELDISTLAADKNLTLTEKSVLRFQQYDNGSFGSNSTTTRAGIFIDDVEMSATSRSIQTIEFPNISAKTFGDAAFDLTATTDSGLPIAYSIVSGPATVSGNRLTITGAGTVVVKAEQVGNNEYEPAVPVEKSFVVSKANQTINFAAIPAKTFGNPPFDLVASSSSSLPVVFTLVSGPGTLSGNRITISGAGILTILATQQGNNNYNAASQERTVTVNKANQTIDFAAIPAKTFLDVPFGLTATASSNLPVTFSIVSGPGTLAGSNVTITGAGSIVIRATQAGNNNYNSATQNRTVTVNKAAQTVTFAALAAKTFGDPPFDLTATSSAGLPVSFTVVSGPGSVTGNKLTINGAGQIVVRASQTGNANYLAAANVDRTMTVNKAVQSITFPAIASQTFGGPAVTLMATSTAGLPITYTVVSGPATVSGNTLTLTGAGTVTVRASQPGGDNHLAAAVVETSFCTNPPQPTIDIDGTEISPELSLKAVGAPSGSSFQWQKDGVDIPGATQELLELSAGGAYTVIVTVGTCSSTSDPVALTSHEDVSFEKGTIQLYPNPASNKFSIQGLLLGQTYQLTIYDGTGRKQTEIDYVHAADASVDLRRYAAGIYLVELRSVRFYAVQRLIISN